MNEYQVKIGFWVRAYDTVVVEADTDQEAIEHAKARARVAIENGGQPDSIDLEDRREGIIVYIDRIGVPIDQATIAEDVEFDDDRIHTEVPAACPSGGVHVPTASGRCPDVVKRTHLVRQHNLALVFAWMLERRIGWFSLSYDGMDGDLRKTGVCVEPDVPAIWFEDCLPGALSAAGPNAIIAAAVPDDVQSVVLHFIDCTISLSLPDWLEEEAGSGTALFNVDGHSVSIEHDQRVVDTERYVFEAHQKQGEMNK